MIYILPDLYRDQGRTALFVRKVNTVRSAHIRSLIPEHFMWRPVRHLGLGFYVAAGLWFNYGVHGFALVEDRPWNLFKRRMRGLLSAITRYHKDPT